MELKTFISTLVFFYYSIFSVDSKPRDLPSYIKKCNRYDPKLNECLVKATEQVKPYITKGIPELGIPSFEPYTIPQIELAQGTDRLNFKMNLTDVIVHGLSNYKFSKLDFDISNLEWRLQSEIGPVNLEGKYQVSGRILQSPIASQGTFIASIANCNITGYQKVEIIKKHGQDYLNLLESSTKIKVAKPQAEVQGSLNGNEHSSKIINQLLKESGEDLFEEIRPVIEKVISEIGGSILKSVSHKIPFDKLFPPTK